MRMLSEAESKSAFGGGDAIKTTNLSSVTVNAENRGQSALSLGARGKKSTLTRMALT